MHNWSYKTCKAPVKSSPSTNNTQCFTGRLPFLLNNQQCQSTCWNIRKIINYLFILKYYYYYYHYDYHILLLMVFFLFNQPLRKLIHVRQGPQRFSLLTEAGNFAGWVSFRSPNQQRQSTEGTSTSIRIQSKINKYDQRLGNARVQTAISAGRSAPKPLAGDISVESRVCRAEKQQLSHSFLNRIHSKRIIN